MQKTKTRLTHAGLLLSAGLLAASLPVFGHHGTGVAYDSEKPTEVKGTITEFQWLNPHARLFIDAKGANGTIEHWAVEMNSPGVMIRQGWSKRQLKPGDEIKITIFPAKSGALVGSCIGRCKVIVNGVDITPKPSSGNEQF